MIRRAARHSRRVAIFLIGTAVILIGIALLVLPGPGYLPSPPVLPFSPPNSPGLKGYLTE